MKAMPILFSAEMVRALLDGRKTQTRRVVKVEYISVPSRDSHVLIGSGICPYGVTGDFLWVRERFSYETMDVSRDGFMPPWYWADGNPASGDFTKPKPSIHMPRWASRLTLEITDVRVERLQDISEADAIAEGVEPVKGGWKAYDREGGCYASAINSYDSLWESLHCGDLDKSWEANPWVWVIEFKAHQVNVGEFLKGKANE